VVQEWSIDSVTGFREKLMKKRIESLGSTARVSTSLVTTFQRKAHEKED